METLHRDADIEIASLENVLVVGWLGMATGAATVEFAKASRALGRRHPTGIVHLNLVAKASSPTNLAEDGRKTIIEMLHDPTHPLVASATVYGGAGFIAATIRGVLAGLTMLARSKVKIRFVASMDEAEPFLRKELGAAGASVPGLGRMAEGAATMIADATRRGIVF